MNDALADLTDTTAESSVRRAAALKIGNLRAEATAEDVLRVVNELKNDHNCEVGGGAISVRRAALLAFTALACGSSDEDSSSSDGTLPESVAACVPAVTNLMTDPDEDAREMAVRACSALGASAPVGALALALQDHAENVRAAAADALVGLRDVLDAESVAQIVDRLTRVDADDEDDDVIRAEVLRVVAGIGEAAASQVGVITACLEDEAAETRAAAAKAVGAIGADAAAAHVAAIAALLEDSEASVRAAAIEALGLIGDADTHAESVSELLGDPDRSVRSAATATLKRWE